MTGDLQRFNQIFVETNAPSFGLQNKINSFNISYLENIQTVPK